MRIVTRCAVELRCYETGAKRRRLSSGMVERRQILEEMSVIKLPGFDAYLNR